MVDTGIFATTAQVQALVGANASATYNTDTYINVYDLLAEAYINNALKYNYSAAGVFAGLTTGKKELLTMAAAAIAAKMVIQADMSGFSLLAEAQTRMDVLDSMSRECIEVLKGDGVQDFLKAA